MRGSIMKKSAKLLGAAAVAVGAMFVGSAAHAETELLPVQWTPA